MSADVTLLTLLSNYKASKELFVKMYRDLSLLRDDTKANKFSLEDQVNIAIIIRETAKYLDDLRKECDGVGTLIEQVCCAVYIKKHLNSFDADPIRTGLVTGSPSMKMCARPPKLRDEPERYYSLMEHFGMSHEVASTGILKAHWPAMKEYLTGLATEGKPLPAGIRPEDTYALYSVVLRANIDLDDVIYNLDLIIANNKTDEERNSKCEEYINKVSGKVRK